MITPAYAITATERVLPLMALDFTTGVLDSRVTVTRALNTATAINSSGFIAIVNANLPRFDYDPVTLAPKGLLIEEARTNLLLRSQEFDNASWSKSAVTVTANTAVSPDGTSNADLLIPTAVSIGHSVSQDVVVNGVNPVTFSAYVKAAGYTTGVLKFEALNAPFNSVNLSFNLTAVTVTPTTYLGGVVLSSSIFSVGNGWFRVIVTATTGFSGNHRNYVFPNNAGAFIGDGTSGILVWGVQTEAGAFATSYIPTTTLAVLRNADDVTMTGTNFTSWYNQSQGALSVKYLKKTTQVSGRYVARFFSPTVGAGVSYWINADGIDTRYWIGATNAVIGNGSLVNVNTGAFSYKTATSTGALNGAANVANAGTVPLDVTEFRIGDAGGINAHIQRILYWPFALTAAEIRANSKG